MKTRGVLLSFVSIPNKDETVRCGMSLCKNISLSTLAVLLEQAYIGFIFGSLTDTDDLGTTEKILKLMVDAFDTGFSAEKTVQRSLMQKQIYR